MRAVDVGDEVEAHADRMVGGQGLDGHRRAEVGAADADVDDVGDRMALGALPVARTDGIGEVAHLVEDLLDLRHDLVAVDGDVPP